MRENCEFFVMIDGEQSVGSYPTLDTARENGQRLCDAEPLPCTFAIMDGAGNEIEAIRRTDGRGLAELVRDFESHYRG